MPLVTWPTEIFEFHILDLWFAFYFSWSVLLSIWNTSTCYCWEGRKGRAIFQVFSLGSSAAFTKGWLLGDTETSGLSVRNEDCSTADMNCLPEPSVSLQPDSVTLRALTGHGTRTPQHCGVCGTHILTAQTWEADPLLYIQELLENEQVYLESLPVGVLWVDNTGVGGRGGAGGSRGHAWGACGAVAAVHRLRGGAFFLILIKAL